MLLVEYLNSRNLFCHLVLLIFKQYSSYFGLELKHFLKAGCRILQCLIIDLRFSFTKMCSLILELSIKAEALSV